MPATPGNTIVGFIGLGVMGRSMAGHLLKAGYELHIHNRTKSKGDELVADGAVWHGSVSELSALCDVIITIVGFPSDVDALYFGADGIIENAKAGAVLVDMTTSDPKLSVEIYKRASERNIAATDAPVSGGDVGAREARLSIMVGGEQSAYEDVLPLFEIMGKTVVRQGPAGSGQHCKACNQISIAAGMLGVCEAVAYAERSGLDPATVLESISGGAAGSWSLSNLAPRMIAGNFDPGFFVKHFIKDMQIAADSSNDLGFETPGLALALSMYKKLASRGGGDDGTQALFKLYRKD